MANNVLITGANRGIGLALVKQFIAAGDQVFAVCRESSIPLQETEATIIDGVDVLHEQTFQNILQALGTHSIDILINNAGILQSESVDNMQFDSILKQFQVNAMGPLKMTTFLIDSLSANAKIAMVTSRMGSISDNGSGGYYGYRMSKAALNAASVSLAKDLSVRGIAVAILHPGFVQTDMVGGAGDIDPDSCAAQLKQRIEQVNLSNSGTFWHANGESLPW